MSDPRDFDFEGALAELGELFAATEGASPDEVRWFVEGMRKIGAGVAARVRPLMDAKLAAARAAGYAEAVEVLRDDERYRDWWSALPQEHPDYGYWSANAREQFAAYLEAVGPGGQPEQKETDCG